MMTFSIVPEWVYFIVTLIFVLFSYEVGFRFGTRRRLRPGDNPEEDAGTLSGTAMGLLAFMLAFTFNGAATNHSLRNDLLIEEANVIRTTYQYSMALPDPQRTKIRNLLEEYIGIRANANKVKNVTSVDVEQAIKRTVILQSELWSEALLLQQQEPNTPIVKSFTESLSNVFDLHVKRFETTFHGRIAVVTWTVLYLLMFIVMALIGYRIGLNGVRSAFVETGMALAFSSVLFLIIALDRPAGMLKLSQQPMITVLEKIRAGG